MQKSLLINPRSLQELNEEFKRRIKYADLKTDEAVTFVKTYAGMPSIVYILNSNGCTWLNTKGGGCFMCGYDYMNFSSAKKTTKDFITQVKKGLAKHKLNGFGVWLLAASFIDDSEIPEEAQYKILEMLAKDRHVRRIWFETRPQYVKEEKIQRIAEITAGIEVFVAMGLETISDYVRLNCINKGYTLKQFEGAVNILNKNGLNAAAYVLFKPPFLSEKKAIEDSVETINYCFDRNITASLCVMGIHPNTVLGYLYKEGKYQLPSLWSIVEVIKQTHRKGHLLFVTENDPSSCTINTRPVFANTCPKCFSRVNAALDGYTATQDIAVLEGLNCSCKQEWAKKVKV